MHKRDYDFDEDGGEMGGCGHHGCGCHRGGMGMMGMGMYGWSGESHKEFKLAILKKKERMLQAKLEFLRDMMKMVEKMPMDEKKEM
ncbi:MAG: hypothetical protein P4L62_01985 [Candidatus Pacebacteria bacterium]|nr:hypothetical protein [Candidatus Paceibacterota bacterium]